MEAEIWTDKILGTKVKTISATFTHITSGEPPSLAFHKILTRPDGKQKYMTMSVPIRDADLLARAEQELTRGDEITVTIETRWAEAGLPKPSGLFQSHCVEGTGINHRRMMDSFLRRK